MGIDFKDEEQRKRFEKFANQTITPTRYADRSCLQTLGLLDSVNWMFDRKGWSHLLTLQHPTYKRLTLEFLSSFTYKYANMIRGKFGGTRFRLFGKDYDFNHDEIGNLLHFQTSLRAADKVPTDGPWTHNFGYFWRRLTGDYATKMAGKKSSHIHNPAIRYFHRILAHTVFGRGESTGTVNMRELYIINCVFKPREFHTAAFMLTHMDMIANASSGGIAFGGLITSLAYALGLGARVEQLPVLEGSVLVNLSSCLNQKLVKMQGQNEYILCIQGEMVNHIVLPNPSVADVRNEENWLYPFDTVDDEQGEDTDTEMDRQTRLSPPHPHMSHASTSHAPPPHPHYDPPPPPYMHVGFLAGTSYTSQSSVEYELNALRHEVAELRAAPQERNDREAEQDHQMRVNSHMIRQMFTWMTRHGMPPADSDDDV